VVKTRIEQIRWANPWNVTLSSVLWHCWLGDRKDIRSVKSYVLVCGWWWFDWSFIYLTASVVTTTSSVLSANKIQTGDILAPAYPDCPGKWLWNECCYHCITVNLQLISVRFNGLLNNCVNDLGWQKSLWEIILMAQLDPSATMVSRCLAC